MVEIKNNMKITNTENKLCLSCMETHNVNKVEIEELVTLPDRRIVKYLAKYEYCDHTDEFTTYDNTLNENHNAFKDAYKKVLEQKG